MEVHNWLKKKSLKKYNDAIKIEISCELCDNVVKTNNKVANYECKKPIKSKN